jgi:methylmalonyl-CoA mutase N-terminal domain/subunit
MSTYLPGPHQTALEGWQSAYDASQERPAPFTTLSGEPIRPLYTEADLPADPAAAIGLPGQYPYTRGVYASMYRGRLWTMRQFAGFGTAEETNERFRYLLDHGQTGLSTAFDMPSLMGHDSDSPRSLGEVGPRGRGGRHGRRHADAVPRHRPRRRQRLHDDQRAAAIMLAYYVVAAERQDVGPERLAGTIQADILKEYIAQKEWCFPDRPGDAAARRHDRVEHGEHAALELGLHLGLPHP